MFRVGERFIELSIHHEETINQQQKSQRVLVMNRKDGLNKDGNFSIFTTCKRNIFINFNKQSHKLKQKWD